jgi:hypothetical protein
LMIFNHMQIWNRSSTILFITVVHIIIVVIINIKKVLYQFYNLKYSKHG